MADATATTTASTVTGGISSGVKSKNLETAANLVRAQLNISYGELHTTDTSGDAYTKRNAYDRALATVITKYPDKFSDQAVLNAQSTLRKNYTPLDNTGFDISAFAGMTFDNGVAGAWYLGNNVKNVVKNSLDAVENTTWVLKYGLPVIALAGLALFVYIKSGGKKVV